MTGDELEGIVARLRAVGDDTADVEAKAARTALPKSVRETVSAFQNAHGGVLVLGLDEKGGFEATGVDEPAKIRADLASLCAQEMEPPVRPLVATHTFEGQQLVVAEIPELDAAQRPSYYKGAGMNRGSFVRVSDGDQHLTSYEVQLMLAARGQPVDDEQPVVSADLDDLDPELVGAYVARIRRDRPRIFGDTSDETVLRRTGVVGPTETGLRPTLAGLLALGTYPQQHFPQLSLTFVRYPSVDGPGADGIRFLDNAHVEGPVPLMVRDALAAIRSNMARRAVVTGAGRTDVWEYPEIALREAITNALAHRDLSPASRGTQVQVEMYPDRIVVRNPGGLFGPVRLDRLGGDDLVSSARNARLMKILEDVEMPGLGTVCENRGSGIRDMRTALRNAGMRPPELIDRISTFTVTLGSLVDQPARHSLPSHAPRQRADRSAEILRAIGAEQLSRAQITERTGLSSGIVTRWLRRLREAGDVEAVGGGPRSPNITYRRVRAGQSSDGGRSE
ncbi:ATP-dependent DNA helicase RecG [Isoptericola sp. CG 20/1183]|uniref:ATP-dependent DNA helicase RecG n=1 Tax=Isoptericola halotolerans TaxID=300560 RepID=A0ABX5EFC0_9MICO|nr:MULTISPECIES: ATP-binding protein [Isoptericola]PRZ08092.1 ATP-dependent DNA helicase RecG [Isoptericola halotolerans]PRZ08890.1 ATP-dependent DNA helicase RecG [Isoptericola sp. CG 20/1183]